MAVCTSFVPLDLHHLNDAVLVDLGSQLEKFSQRLWETT